MYDKINLLLAVLKECDMSLEDLINAATAGMSEYDFGDDDNYTANIDRLMALSKQLRQ